ncbi:hypothetical protein KXD40_008596 [Peronospora effusa]|uniref:Uncharacterized protein n=1 Tax=Peronospora effusa TaxID=542832 RepID=A0A3M6VKV4_9STRA|nr:hypothetical protein DD238_003439 [Peronospora effusa]RQM15393.1 hypothetical protein DD237_004134 [Peronospora effusa]UIZ24369.1 hypothetical protein KXD40_008596 [Peronospora effusa]
MAWGKKTGVDDLLQKLVNPKTATSLYVMSTRCMSDSDFVRLAGSISSNTMLQELYVSGHELGPQSVQAFADCLAMNSKLQHLSLGSEKLGDDAVKVLCAGLARNPQSGLLNWDLELKSLGVDGVSAIAELLKTNKVLTTLTLSRNQIGDEGMEKLAKGLSENVESKVKELNVADVGISGAGLDHLEVLVANVNCSLTTLQLSFNSLTSATSAFFDALATNKSVKKLQLKECKLTDEHVAALASALKQNTTLTEIDLSDNELTPISCASLAEGLRDNKTLEILRLSNNKCGDDGAVLLAEVLAAHNTTLVYLDMSNNGLTSGSMTLLLKAQSITQLHLFNNKLGEGLSELLPVLLTNSVIETLGVGVNQLHEGLSVMLFDALHSHPSLKTLEMGGNTLGKEGHAALEKLKEANSTLDVAVDKNAQNEDGSFDCQD